MVFKKKMTIADRFWSHVKKGDGNECWEWMISRFRNGYGKFAVSREKTAKANRMAWELLFGPIPDGMCVLHKCDNPGCVRPDHLFLGTPADNARDRNSKGRQAIFRGESHSSSKLTDNDVRAIRSERSMGASLVVLSQKYGVTIQNISQIYLRKSWRHI